MKLPITKERFIVSKHCLLWTKLSKLEGNSDLLLKSKSINAEQLVKQTAPVVTKEQSFCYGFIHFCYIIGHRSQ